MKWRLVFPLGARLQFSLAADKCIQKCETNSRALAKFRAAGRPLQAGCVGSPENGNHARMPVARVRRIWRLERGRFIWPSASEGVVTITAVQLGYLLEGIDWRMPQHTWRPQAAG
jgi:transposase